MHASRALRILALAGTVAAVCAGPAGVAQADDAGATTVVGELVQAWPDTALEGRHAGEAHEQAHEEPLSFVEAADGSAVRVPTGSVAGIGVGSTVEVTVGGTTADEAAADGLEPAREVIDAQVLEPARPAATVPAGSVTNQVTVVMVAPRGGTPDGTALADVVDTVNRDVAGFWAEETGGAVTVGVTAAHDWISTTAGCADPTELWDEAAAHARFEPGPGRHLLLYVTSRPQELPGCSYALGQVGTGTASGGRLYVRDDLASVISHELGHNFGLGHSSGLQCDGTVEGGACRTAAYRDFYDVMGVSWDRTGSLTAAQADRLGVLPPAAVQAVGPGTTTATLAPLGGRTGTRVLRLTDAAGTDYWLEYRAAAGRDAWLASDNRYRLDAGVLLHRSGTLPDTSLLLDGSPSAQGRWEQDLQTALVPGVPVVVAGGQFTVTVGATGPAGAAVTVVATPPVSPAAAAPAPAAPAPAVLPGDGAGTSAGTGTPATRPATAAVPAAPAPSDAVPAAVAKPAPVAEPAAEAAAAAVATPAPAAAVERATPVEAAATSPAGRGWTTPALAAGGLLGASGTALAARRLLRARRGR